MKNSMFLFFVVVLGFLSGCHTTGTKGDEKYPIGVPFVHVVNNMDYTLEIKNGVQTLATISPGGDSFVPVDVCDDESFILVAKAYDGNEPVGSISQGFYFPDRRGWGSRWTQAAPNYLWEINGINYLQRRNPPMRYR